MVFARKAPSVASFLLDYGTFEWQRTPHDLEKVPNVAYDNVLNDFDLVWCLKGLIVTRTNLLVIWKMKPRMSIISWAPWFCIGSLWGGCISSLAIDFFAPPKNNTYLGLLLIESWFIGTSILLPCQKDLANRRKTTTIQSGPHHDKRKIFYDHIDIWCRDNALDSIPWMWRRSTRLVYDTLFQFNTSLTPPSTMNFAYYRLFTFVC